MRLRDKHGKFTKAKAEVKVIDQNYEENSGDEEGGYGYERRIGGRGIYISDLLVKYFYKPYEIEDYILFQYYISLDLNIENDIHKINNEKFNIKYVRVF